jgi:hypothetical protein
VLQEQPPGVRLATSYCLCDLKRSKSNRSASMVTLYKLENLQMGVFSEVRQKICQGPELSVLTSVTNNHPSCAAPQGCESRCPRAPVKGGPLFYSDRDRNARWPIPSSLSDIPRAPCLNLWTCFKRHKLSSWLMFATYRAHAPTRNSTEKHWPKSWLRFK